MAKAEHLEIFEQGREAWNEWRRTLDEDIKPDLSELDLVGFDLSGFNLGDTKLIDCDLTDAKFVGANMDGALLHGATLCRADFSDAALLNSVITGADLSDAYLAGLDACGVMFLESRLDRANLSGSALLEADFSRASLVGANLSHADLARGEFESADLTGADLSGAILTNAALVDTVVEGAKFSGAKIFGISVWNLKGTPSEQEDLVIVPHEEGLVTVDDLEVAQFVYLMYDNKKIRNVLNTVTGKAVLILGRFTPPERKAVLDGLRNKLREFDLLPIVFDFDRPADKDYTETVQTLAGMSRFVIADVTNPKSTPLELEAVVKQFKIPYVPILDISVDPNPFAMIVDLQKNFHWVLQTVAYESKEELLENLELLILDRAIAKHNELQEQKAKQVTLLTLDELKRAGARSKR